MLYLFLYLACRQRNTFVGSVKVQWRWANYVLFSFSLPSLCDDALTAAGNHTFAAVKCSECYESLKGALERVLAEMNELIKVGEISCPEMGCQLIKLIDLFDPHGMKNLYGEV